MSEATGNQIFIKVLNRTIQNDYPNGLTSQRWSLHLSKSIDNHPEYDTPYVRHNRQSTYELIKFP